MIAAVGEPRYVEPVGIVARVVAVDTFCRLLGLEPPPPPASTPGDPSYESVREMVDPGYRRGLLDRPRMELVATTVSQVDECFY